MEIKFRVWCCVDRWAYEVTFFSSGGWEARSGIEGYNENDGAILMQYTGFKDKHGKPIYEGDIIKHPPYWHDDREVHAVKDIHMFCGDYGNYGDIETEIEVIGNIYETPELLQQQGGKL